MQNFQQIQVGDKRMVSKLVSEHDVEVFATITGDTSLMHIDDNFASKTVFKGKIVHGMFSAALISAAVCQFPGTIIYLSQSLVFLVPVKIHDKIEAIAEVIEKIEHHQELKLLTICKNQNKEDVICGEARVRIIDLED